MTARATDLFRLALELHRADTSTPKAWGNVKAPNIAAPSSSPDAEQHALEVDNTGSASGATSPIDRDEVRRIDDGGHNGYVELAILDELVATIGRSPSKAHVNTWMVEANEAGVPWNPRQKRTPRRWEIARAAHWCSILVDAHGPAAVRTLIACALDNKHAEQTTTPIGRWLADLTTDEAKHLSDMAEAHLVDPDPAANPVA